MINEESDLAKTIHSVPSPSSAPGRLPPRQLASEILTSTGVFFFSNPSKDTFSHFITLVVVVAGEPGENMPTNLSFKIFEKV